MADVKLVATKDFSYSTRRLKAGDEFTVPANMARVLVGIGKAQEPRQPGQVPPPPARVVRAAATRAPRRTVPTADEALSKFLGRSIPDISGDLGKATDAQLQTYLSAERGGKSRKGLVEAIEAEVERRKG